MDLSDFVTGPLGDRLLNNTFFLETDGKDSSLQTSKNKQKSLIYNVSNILRYSGQPELIYFVKKLDNSRFCKIMI